MNPPSKQCVKREEGGVEIGEWTNRDKFCTREFFFKLVLVVGLSVLSLIVSRFTS